MISLKSNYPPWLQILAVTQTGALLVFMSFSGALPILQAEWEITNTQAGAIQSAGQFGYLLSVLIISSLADYVDPKRLIVAGAIWAGISNLLFAGYAHDTSSAIIFRVLIGIGIAGIYMPGVKLISQHVPRGKRGRAIGFFVASFTLGAALSIALGGNLASAMGWRLAFAVTTFGPILGAVLSWKYLPNSVKATGLNETPPPIKELLNNRQAILIILLYATHAWEVLGMRSWLATYLTAVRTNGGAILAEATSSGATIAGLATIIAAIATASFGAFSDRMDRIKLIIIVMTLGFFSTILLGFSFTSPWILVILISLIASFLLNADSAVISTQLMEVVGESFLGRTLAIYSFFGFAAGSVSPLVFGAVLDYAGTFNVAHLGYPWAWAFSTFAIASFIGLIIAVYLQSVTKLNDKSIPFSQP